MKDQESSGLALYHSRHTVWLGEALMRADQLEDALAQAERGLALTRERGERGLEAWALWLLGEIASRRDPPNVETAEGHYREAVALAEEAGMRPLVARCHNGLGKLYRGTGKQQQAHQHLITATSMYREMDMRYWLEQAEEQMQEMA
jgi:tetratricopeptide (TPR) repeat protein